LDAATSLKKKILKLLKEDEEFRYAVAGLLGLDTILSELRKLRGRLQQIRGIRGEKMGRK